MFARRTRSLIQARKTEQRNRRRRLRVALEPLESRMLLAFSATVFADINELGISANVDSMVEFDGRAFFSADDGQTGSELWTSDGTGPGTSRFADLLPGTDGSQPSDLTVVGTELFFTAVDESGERDLWKTDGTTEGTAVVYDANEAGVYGLERLTESGGKLFFTAYQIDTDPGPGDNATGQELWVSDGSAGGTMMLLDINPDQTGYGAEGPQELTDHNGTLFFTSYDSDFNRDLWKSDGTTGTTIKVQDLNDLNTSDLTSVGSNLFFAAEDAPTGKELYVYDGLTTELLQINPEFESSSPRDITAFDNGSGVQAYFSADDGSGTRSLFKSDGLSVTPVTGGAAVEDPKELTVVGSNLFFSAESDGVTISDSSPALTSENTVHDTGTFAGIVESVDVGGNSGTLTVVPAESPNDFTAEIISGTSSDGPGWVLSGAIGDAGVGLETLAVGDLYLESIDSADAGITSFQWEWEVTAPTGQSFGNIEFHGFASGTQFDNTSGGSDDEGFLFEVIPNVGPTTQVEVRGDDLDNWFAGRDAGNINLSHPGGSAVTSAIVRMTFFNVQMDGGSEAAVVNAELTATYGAGRELYRTDGTTNTLVKDIVAGGSSNPSQLTESNGRLYFSADEPTTFGRELWTSPEFGDFSSTVRLTDSRTGVDVGSGSPLSGDPQDLVDIDGTLFFTTLDDNADRELWTSAGVVGDPTTLKNINPSTKDAGIEQVVVHGTDIYFVANDGINGEAVWVADTTSPGTVTMIDMTPGTSAESISGLSIQDGSVWFYNNIGGGGSNGAIYRTTGTPAGTTEVAEQTPISSGAGQNNMFVTYNSQVYFASEDAEGVELWRSDVAGTSASRFIDIFPGTNGNGGQNSSNPGDLTVFNGKLYFAAENGVVGRELWETGGTGATTMVAHNIDPGLDDSNPAELTVSGNRLFFSANNGTDALSGGIGQELWTLDTSNVLTGIDIDTTVTNSGTVADGSFPVNLTDINGTLYFSADNANDEDDEPYTSDGATATRIQNINTTSNIGSKPSGFTEFDGDVYFAATSTDNGRELWRTPSSSPTTAVLVHDVTEEVAPLVISTAPSASPTELFAATGRLFYSAVDENTSDRELWTAGGPLATGAAQALDLFPGVFQGSNPTDIVEIGGTVYFVGQDELSGRELFVVNQGLTPQVESVVINDGSAQRSQITSVTVTFDNVVDVDPVDFVLTNIDSATVVTNVLVDISEQDFKTVAVLTFGTSGASIENRAGTGVLGNSLADGNYRLDLLASAVLDPTGGPGLAADYAFGGQLKNAPDNDDFYRLYGDIDADGDTDFTDFANDFLPGFGTLFGQPAFRSGMDYDGDGDQDFTDFANGFLPNFGSVRT